MEEVKELVMALMVKSHQKAKDKGLSTPNLCYLYLAYMLKGTAISKSRLAFRLGLSRAGVGKMFGKMEDLVTVKKLPSGLFVLQVTEKGDRFITRIMFEK